MPGFIGVVPINQLASMPPLRDRQSLVINYFDEERQHGNRHWVAARRLSDQVTEFFDSFGSPPAPPVAAYLKRGAAKIHSSSRDIQAWNSVACGAHCVHFILESVKGKSLSQISHEFPQFLSYDTDPVLGNDRRLALDLKNL